MEQNKAEANIHGSVEKIVFRNDENGFSVIRVKVQGNKELITVVGNIVNISVGEAISATGCWFNDTKYGMQLRADTIVLVLPTTVIGIKKYLSSGLIKGIGAHFAEKVVSKFGLYTIDIIENNPERLTEIDGIGVVRAKLISKSWQDNKLIRDLMIFLQGHGISGSLASKIFRRYQQQSLNILKEDPYRLVKDIKGIGFLTADKIAMNLGVEYNSPKRAQAAVSYILSEASSSGHCALPYYELLDKGVKHLNIDSELLEEALCSELRNNNLISIPIDSAHLIGDIEKKYHKSNLVENKVVNDDLALATSSLIFLPVYFYYERLIAKKLALISKIGEPLGRNLQISDAISWLSSNYRIRLSDSQQQALHTIADTKLAVVTGGPGTGKTTLINSIIKVFTEYQNSLNKSEKSENFSYSTNIQKSGTKLRIKLAAPTGRAAKRLAESTRRPATTIHRLLKFDPQIQSFTYNENNQLLCDLLIIDESSMIDVYLMATLLKALPVSASLILVGDVDQIPSVGPGQVLADIISSNVVSVICLNKIFRQAANSQIVTNAHLINRGYLPKLSKEENQSDFWFLEMDDTENIVKKITTLLKHEIPKIIASGSISSLNKSNLFKSKVDINADNIECTEESSMMSMIKDVQVLSPMQKGGLGSRALNIELQKILNPNYQSNSVEKFGQLYAFNDKVMQIENNYDKLVFNGDIGFIIKVNTEEQVLIVDFDGREIEYDFNELDQLTLAYAITIHKAQGSEYPIVILPIVTAHYIMLNKNLLYTAITRGKSLVILLGQKKAVAMAVHNKSTLNRYSKLKDWLNYDLTLAE